MDLQEVGCRCMDWIDLALDRDRLQALVNAVMNLRGSIIILLLNDISELNDKQHLVLRLASYFGLKLLNESVQ